MYNCYYHPKMQGAGMCKGCKLPVCAGCSASGGFCPECVKTRQAVWQLQQLRGAVADRSKLTSSTTARLRLAIRSASNKAVAPELANRPGMSTAPLPALDEAVRPAPRPQPVQRSATGHTPAPARKSAARRGTGTWKYDPTKIAYRAPENLPKPAPAPKRAAPTQPVAQLRSLSELPYAGAVARVVGIVATASVLLFGMALPMYQSLHKPVVHMAVKPLYTPLSRAERAMMNETLHPASAPNRDVQLPAAAPAPARSSVKQAAAKPAPAEPAPVAAAPAPEAPAQRQSPRYMPVARHYARAYAPRTYAPRFAAAPRYAAPQVAYQPRAAYIAPAAPVHVQRRRSSLADAMHFSGPGVTTGVFSSGRASAGSTPEVIHW